MPTVLVTRPRSESESLAACLEGLGFETWVEPLLTPVPSEMPRPAAGGVRALVLTSAQSLVALQGRREALADLMHRPVFCVGPHTADVARAFGFQDVVAAEGDGGSLAAKICSVLPPGDEPLLHIGGVDRSGKVEVLLQASGYCVKNWAVYKAEAAQALSAALLEKIKKNELEAALFFSPRTAAVFCDLLKAEGLSESARPMLAVAMSEAVAAPLRLVPFGRVCVAAHPSQQAMIETLQKACAHSLT